ncbi:cytochrome P450 [Streptomyces tateyamensis]|uniref:Cytochrome P450 n=1 Tax=Streptomyces tateyamensis TaxID=565073 RepID=A0A2V4NLL9_9ACTN|nr:cytochrome P450 [Streptomyces tateyamensis]PYC76721.1 cytochrome P450 [Streptomyces tateyamensis]
MTTAEQLGLPAPRPAGCPFDPPPNHRRASARFSLWDGNPCWLLTDYQQIRTVLMDRRFSADAHHPTFPFTNPVAREVIATRKQSFLRMDDPEHSRLRRMMTTDFLIKKVDALRPRIQRIVDQTLDEMIATGSPADLVARFALPVPSLVICELLGVPYADHEFFQEQGRLLLDTSQPLGVPQQAMDALTGYLAEVAAAKQGDPDGVIAKLAARGDLTPEEVAANGVLLLLAGHETTANMTSLSTVALLRHPAQAERLRQDPGLILGAVEELLRYLTIVHTGVPRVALERVDLGGGVVVEEGDGVLCAISTANRDPELFGDAEQLDVERDARRHLAFGFGVHQCLGQPLARAELQIALGTLLRRLPTLRLAVPFEELRFRTEALIYGLHELPVAW